MSAEIGAIHDREIGAIPGIIPPSIESSEEPFSDTEKTTMSKWLESRQEYLDVNPNIARFNVFCPISQERIYDPVELNFGTGQELYERHSLLNRLLLFPSLSLPILAFSYEISLQGQVPFSVVRNIFASR